LLKGSAWCWVLVDENTAEAFAVYMKKFMDLYQYLAQIVRNNTKALQPVIVDLGAGPGLLSVEIHQQMPQATILAIDPLMKMLCLAKEHAREAYFDSFEAMLGISEHLSLKNNTVDLIVSRFSLPYWKRPDQSFLEMSRVLKPGGRVVLEALNRDYPFWKLQFIRIKMLVNHAGRDVTKYHVDAYRDAHTMAQVEHFFVSAGFKILEKEGKKGDWRFIMVAEKPKTPLSL
jgi:ubiquinone/menaquinone biosynthesis C-methylase UbiE